MQKIKHYTDNSFDFYKNILSRKHASSFKDWLTEHEEDIRSCFEEYDNAFGSNELASLQNHQFASDKKEELKSLYKFEGTEIRKLRMKLEKDENGHYYSHCPFCEITEIQTLDHIIPKEEFPEYSVHPLNLVRCCMTCNTNKSTRWRDGEIRRYPDPYIDEIPNIQYLFVSFTYDDNNIICNYSVNNRNRIDASIYRKLENMFNDFKFAKRYRSEAFNYIPEIVTSIKYRIQRYGATIIDIKDEMKYTAKQFQKDEGFNYWKAITLLGITDDETAMNYIMQKSKI